jgi:predicted transglutaminase-like cysteine proteinase
VPDSFDENKNSGIWGMYENIPEDPDRRRRHRASKITALASFAAMTIFGACAAEQAFALSPMPVSGDAVSIVGQAGPTPAWIAFCSQFPQECAVDPSEPAAIAMTQSVWDTLVDVNERVNASVLPVTDQDHWGVADRWDYPDDGLGDCEDIQLLKRRLLTKAGLPQRALRMTVVIDELGAGHAVLMVRTDRGDFILDNKRNAVLSWQKTGYRYVKREGSESKSWVWLGNQPAPMVTATK